MKVALVNATDSALDTLRAALEGSAHEVCWVARDGPEALRLAERERPDLVLLDVRLPGRDAVEVTRRLVAGSPIEGTGSTWEAGSAVLIVTGDVDQVSQQVFLALQAGALDATEVPTDDCAILLEKIAMVARLVMALPRPAPRKLALVAIGASAGGPAAVSRVLARLPLNFPAAVVVVQHIDQAFSANLVKLLAGHSPLPVIEVQGGHQPAPGQVLVAGGTDHLVLSAGGRLNYTHEPAGGLYRPSIDVFFSSLVGSTGSVGWKGPLVGVLLTGMGSDGARGLLLLRQAGHWTVAQDEATSAIYGMPRAAALLGAAAQVLPLEAIGPALVARLRV